MRTSARRWFSCKLAVLCFGLIAVCAVGLIAVPRIVAQGQDASDAIVATVDKEPIAVAEWKRQIQLKRAETVRYFRTKYGETEEAALWAKSYDGERPLEVLKSDALDAAVRIKLQQMLARKNGLIRDLSYRSFESDLQHENERRAAALKNKQVIYGPTQYTEDAYFEYEFSNMVARLKEKLASNEINVTDEELRSEYEASKDTLFRKGDETDIEKIFLSYVDSDGSLNEAKKRAALRIMEQTKEKLDKGASFETLAAEVNEADDAKKNYGRQSLGGSAGREDAMYNGKLIEEAEKLAVGQISGIFETNHTFYMIKIMDKHNAEYAPFDEVKSMIRTNAINKKYDALIDRLAKDAKLEIKHDVYDSMKAIL
jgi:parvulin-like peptidyl-prolyl isomerase